MSPEQLIEFVLDSPEFNSSALLVTSATGLPSVSWDSYVLRFFFQLFVLVLIYRGGSRIFFRRGVHSSLALLQHQETT